MEEEQSKMWSCPVCTLKNSADRTNCDACNTPAPPTTGQKDQSQSPPLTRAASEEKALSTFTLYHYNGIDGYGKAVAECKRVKVTWLGEGVPNDQNLSEGLNDVIQTRWPGSLIEYIDGPPKII